MHLDVYFVKVSCGNIESKYFLEVAKHNIYFCIRAILNSSFNILNIFAKDICILYEFYNIYINKLTINNIRILF